MGYQIFADVHIYFQVSARVCAGKNMQAWSKKGLLTGWCQPVHSVSTMWIFDFLLEVQNFGGWKVSAWLVLSKTQALSHNRASLDKKTAHTHWCMLLLEKRSCSAWPPPRSGRKHMKSTHGFLQTLPDVSFSLTGPVAYPHCVPIVNLTCEYNHMLSTVSPCSEALNVPVILAPLTQQVSDRRTSHGNLPKPPNGMTQTLHSYNHRFLGWIMWPS